jgi:hypothetical protein
MSQKVAVNLDLIGNQILGLRTELLAADPSGAGLYTGRLWYNSTSDQLKYYAGATLGIIVIGAGVASLTVDNSSIENTGTAGAPSIRVKALGITDAMLAGAISNGKLATNPLARANHTGTQAAATISDFDTQVRTNRLDQMAAPTAAVPMNTQKITGMGDPTAAQDAATKAYVDAVVQGFAMKESVRAATTVAGTLATSFANGSTIDGVVLATGDRILIKDQAAAAENGIYTVNAAGAPTRATDFDSTTDVESGAVFVEQGTVNLNTLWLMISDNVTVGTNQMLWNQIGGVGTITGGTGITMSGNQVNLTVPVTVANGGTGGITAAAAKTNLGFMTRFAVNSSASTVTTVTHNLGTLDVTVCVYEVATGALVIADVVLTSINVVTVTFAVAATSGQYRIVVIG